MKIIKYYATVLLVAGVLMSGLAFSLDREKGVSDESRTLRKPLVVNATNFDGNRIDNDLMNNGMIVSHIQSGRSGMSWPKGNGTQTIYASGVWLGAKVGGQIRVVVGEFAGEFVGGPWGSDPSDPAHKLYKINKSDLADPLANDDFQNWPAHLGAPFIDNNGNGTYEPLPAGPDTPEFIGDQVIWAVMNDGDPTAHSVFNSPPMGLEVQMTVFGFDRPDVFGDMMFVKELIINRGEETLEDMMIGLWSDPDLGDAADDLVGCDTTLGMGIVYNSGADAAFAGYSGGTPAAGYDFFQGPMVPSPGDTAYMFDRSIPDMRNLKMSSFTKYINGDDTYYDPNNAVEAYNYMTGFMPDGSDFPFAASGGTKFVHPGDPTLNVDAFDTEYVDEDLHPPDDRRFLMNAGPFTMVPGDSQEVVFGIINVAAGSALDSYLYLKEVDALAQLAYDIHFALPPSPPNPEVEIHTYDNEIVLNWGDSAEAYVAEDKVDKHPVTGENTEFVFEGYNVWQIETASGSGAKKIIATYDLTNGITEIFDDVFSSQYGETINRRVQFGSDSGLKRSISITADALNDGSALLTNRVYYFAVTAYGYNQYGIPKTLESPFNVLAIRPQVNTTWMTEDETAVYGTEIIAEHTGSADATVTATVVDPRQLTGGSYEVFTNVQHYWAGLDGFWNTTNTQGVAEKRIGKVLDCDGSTVTLTGLEAEDGTVDLTFTFDMHCGSNWVDGIMLDFADDITINSWDNIGSGCVGVLDETTNAITWGNDSRSQDGCIHGNLVWVVNVQSIGLPATVGYAIYDDGWDGTIVDVVSNAVLGYAFASLPHWNLMNSATSVVLVEDQFILNGVALDHVVNGAYIEGGLEDGMYDFPLVDGFTVSVDGGYDAPSDFFNLELGDEELVSAESSYDIDSYMASGWGVTAKAIDTYGTGFTSVDVLQQDVKVVFDGVLGEPLANGFVPVVEGGSQAWVWNANTLATHTSPANPGTGEPFLVTVPFKVYNMEADGQPQISIIMRDRIQPHDGTYDGNDDGIPETHAFNPYDRMYCWFVNRPYEETLNDFASNEEYLTWNTVWWATGWTIGDELLFEYANPIQHGLDTFAFGTTDYLGTAKTFDPDGIKVWPNPYFGFNPEERDPVDQQIHFTNLPMEGKCTIRVFDLSGVPVKTIQHDNGTTLEVWNLKNDTNIPVASGMYIVVFETDEGQKILKIAIIQSEQRLDILG